MKLIHEIGLELRSSAVCTALRRLRYGHFTLSHALLMRHGDARSIAENITFCRPAVDASITEERAETVRQRIELTDDQQLDQGQMGADEDDDDDVLGQQQQPSQ